MTSHTPDNNNSMTPDGGVEVELASLQDFLLDSSMLHLCHRNLGKTIEKAISVLGHEHVLSESLAEDFEEALRQHRFIQMHFTNDILKRYEHCPWFQNFLSSVENLTNSNLSKWLDEDIRSPFASHANDLNRESNPGCPQSNANGSGRGRKDINRKAKKKKASMKHLAEIISDKSSDDANDSSYSYSSDDEPQELNATQKPDEADPDAMQQLFSNERRRFKSAQARFDSNKFAAIDSMLFTLVARILLDFLDADSSLSNFLPIISDVIAIIKVNFVWEEKIVSSMANSLANAARMTVSNVAGDVSIGELCLKLDTAQSQKTIELPHEQKRTLSILKAEIRRLDEESGLVARTTPKQILSSLRSENGRKFVLNLCHEMLFIHVASNTTAEEIFTGLGTRFEEQIKCLYKSVHGRELEPTQVTLLDVLERVIAYTICEKQSLCQSIEALRLIRKQLISLTEKFRYAELLSFGGQETRNADIIYCSGNGEIYQRRRRRIVNLGLGLVIKNLILQEFPDNKHHTEYVYGLLTCAPRAVIEKDFQLNKLFGEKDCELLPGAKILIEKNVLKDHSKSKEKSDNFETTVIFDDPHQIAAYERVLSRAP